MNVNLHYNLEKSQQIEWDRFWRQSEHTHPRNHLLFGEIERARGQTAVYATGEIDGRLVCAGIFSTRPLLGGNRGSLEAVCQRGPIFDDISYARDFLSQVADKFRELNVGSLRISPYWIYPEAEAVESLLGELGFFVYEGNGKRCPTGLVDLRPSEEEIFAGLKSKTRQEIRRTEKLGVTIRAAEDFEEAKHFYKCLKELHQQRSLDAISFEEFKATFDYIFKERELGVLLNAFYNTTFLGGLWIVRGPKVSHHARFVVERERLRELANLTIGAALWWEAIKWAKSKGCSHLNVEGYEVDVAQTHPRCYVYKLKKKFNPDPVQIISEHVLVCSGGIHTIHKGYRFCQRGVNFGMGLPYQLKRRWAAYKGSRAGRDNGG